MAEVPYSKRVFWLHMASSPLTNVFWAITAMVAVLVRKPDGFNGSELQTALITSSIPVMAAVSIFWNEAYRRLKPSQYLWSVWVVAFVPLAGIALCYRPEAVVLCMLLSSFGNAGTAPMGGDLLRKCYSESCRGRVYSMLSAIGQVSVLLGMFLIGQWLAADKDSFRSYMPISVLAIGMGMILVYFITREPDFIRHEQPRPTEKLRTSLLMAYRGMTAVLREDRSFRRFETAFFIYGTGWMICHAMLPFLVVDKLKLTYDQVANSTHVTFTAVGLIAMIPAGFLVDKIGAFRMAYWAFFLMVIHGIALILANNIITLTIAVAFSGLAMTGIHITWMIGPVTLARDPTQGAHYIAIHATMVGLRALVQFPAVLIYKYTGIIQIPLAVAILCMITGAILMRRLARDPQVARKPVPAPVEAVSGAEHDAMA